MFLPFRSQDLLSEPAAAEETSNAAAEPAAAELHRALIPAGTAVIGKKIGQEVRRFSGIGVLQMEHFDDRHVLGAHIDGVDDFGDFPDVRLSVGDHN